MKKLIKSILASFGWKVMRPSPYELVFFKSKHVIGLDEADDLLRFFNADDRITIVDAGANVGQSIAKYKSIFPNSIIHSFEPSLKIFPELNKNAGRFDLVSTHNKALGSKPGRITFYQYEDHVNSSALPMGKDLSQHNKYVATEVECSTLDIEADQNHIDHINILKIDTQGFDLEVLRGAQKLIDAGKIDIVLIEHIVAELYKDGPAYSEQVRFFEQNNFKLVVSYRLNMEKYMVTWFDSVYRRSSFTPINVR